MSKEKIYKIRYVTKEKLEKVNPDNIKKYEKYRKANILKNREVESSTYKNYKSYFNQFLCYLLEEWDNIDLYSEEFMENAIDIMEGFMLLCQDTLKNHKKVINTKLSAVSSFYLWSFKRRLIERHPFANILDRMKGANEEKVLNDYFLTDEQILKTRNELNSNDKYNIQDQILFELALDSANRLSALWATELSKLNLEEGYFEDIREKRGYRVEIVFNELTKDLIREWLEERKEIDNLEVDYLFITRYNGVYKQMSKSTLQDKIKRMIKDIVGIEDFRIHLMRKTSLNKIYNDSGDLTLAQAMGNHVSIETTSKHYIKPKSKTEIRNKIKEIRDKKIEGDIN
jgi:integrase/recombinase XerC